MVECTQFVIEAINSIDLYYIRDIVLRKKVNNDIDIYLQGCSFPYLNIGGANVRLTVDILGQTVVDQTKVMPGCFFFFCPLLTFTFTIPDTVNGKDTAGRLATIKVSWPGDATRASAERIVQVYVYGDPILNSDKMSVKTGESFTFSGQWYPNQILNIYYQTTDPFTGYFTWREHITGVETDINGDFKVIAILPLDARDANGNPIITTTKTLEFRACPPGSFGAECSTYYLSNIVAIQVSPGDPIPIIPGPYIKTYPESNIYSGNAVSETMHIDAFKYLSIDEARGISLEDARVLVLMTIENQALRQGLILLETRITYDEGPLYHSFDVTYTYIKPAEGIIGLAIPAIYLALAAIGIIIGILLIIGPPEVKDLIWRGIGAAVTGGLFIIGAAAAVIFILPKLLPTIGAVTTRAKELAKVELERRGVTT